MAQLPEINNAPEVKRPSVLAISARSALGLAITGAVVTGLLGAAGLAGMSALNIGGVGTIAGLLGADLAAFAVAGPGSAALAGLMVGSVGGAILGAPAGAIAGPIYVEKKAAEIENAQLRAALPMAAEQGARAAIANVMSAAQQAMPDFDNEFARTDNAERLAAKQDVEKQQALAGQVK